MERNKILAHIQCGGRPNRSTLDHLVRMEYEVQKAYALNESYALLSSYALSKSLI